MSTAPPAPVAPVAPPTPVAPPAPESNVESEETAPEEDSVRKIIWPAPTNPDGTTKHIDFYPDEDSADKCKAMGLPVWIPEVYRIPPAGIFIGPYVKKFWEAKVKRVEADALEVEARDMQANPEKSVDMKKLKDNFAKMLDLSSKLKAQGVDVDTLLAQMQEAKEG